MIFDWHLWPWIVVDGAAGQYGVHRYRLELSIGRVASEIGLRLLPAFRALGVSFARAGDATNALLAGIASTRK